METLTLPHPPRLGLLYGKAAITAALPNAGETLPELAMSLPRVQVDRDHLVTYEQVCRFRVGDQLPATYLHVVSFPVAVALMAQRRFPFALPGLVHVGNTITQHRPLTIDDHPDLRVHVQDLRSHPKGRQFDVVARAELDGEIVWEDISTYLARGKGDAGAPTPGPDHTLDAAPSAAVWEVPADTGRRYAAVSGDRNPIHLHPLTAKLFGFPRQIAHGMWTKARCLAALEGRIGPSFTVDVGFKKPIVLPAEVRLSTQRTAGGWRFALHDADGEAPHLIGEINEA